MLLKPGDIFCSKNPMALGKAIAAVETFWSADNHAQYGHAGIITSQTGNTLEALWTVKSQNLWKAYKGSKVLIGRNVDMGPSLFKHGMEGIRKHKGQLYPFWRLALCIVPPLSKYLKFSGKLVCSELTGKFLYEAGFSAWEQYHGLTPDHVADRIRRWKGWEI
ncbi:MAG: hypothetical protein GY850_27970, partial [bacterium]|nr:hypothetical protein [bacterium]